jgi:uncharacterized RDD family membrane protein YckC
MIAPRPDKTRAPVVIHNSPLYGTPAGFVSRFIALLIDVGLLGVVLLITGVIWFGLLRIVSFGWLDLIAPQLQTLIMFALRVVIPIATVIVVVVGYFLFFFTVTGQTVGKRVLGLRLVSTNGDRVTLRQAFVRLVGYAISAIPIYLGFLAMFFDSERRAWHDRLAHTAVIYDWDARPDERFLARAIQRARERTPDSTAHASQLGE